MQQIHADPCNAIAVGKDWLARVTTPRQPTRVGMYTTVGGARMGAAWKGSVLLAYYLVVPRGDGGAQLVLNDLGPDLP